MRFDVEAQAKKLLSFVLLNSRRPTTTWQYFFTIHAVATQLLCYGNRAFLRHQNSM